MTSAPTDITFFQRFEADILAGKKTITIRDESEKHFQTNTIVSVSTFEHNRWFCDVLIKNVEPIDFDDLAEVHAEQENMSLTQLRAVIKEIYPNQQHFYVISFELV